MIKLMNLGLWAGFSACEDGLIGALNENFELLDALVQAKVIDIVEELPEDPTDGDMYILESDGSINVWYDDAWQTIPARVGFMTFVESEEEYYWYNGTVWAELPTNLGDVTGPASSTDHAIARFVGIDGKEIEDSLVTISDTGEMAGAIKTTTDLLETDNARVDILSVSESIITGLTGTNVTLPALSTVNVHITSAVDSISDITDPALDGFGRVHILVNKRPSGAMVLINNANIRTGTGANLTLENGASVWLVYDATDAIWTIVGGSGASVGTINMTTDTFTGDGVTTVFNLTNNPGSIDNIWVFLTGNYQQKVNYSFTPPNTITFSTAPITGTNNIEIKYGNVSPIGTPADGTVSPVKTNLPSPNYIVRSTPGSGTYTPTAGTKWIKVSVQGGGGGGSAGAGSGGGSGTAGTDSWFGSSAILRGFGGAGGATAVAGVGGSVTTTLTKIGKYALGSAGQNDGMSANSRGGDGGSSYFGHGGSGGTTNASGPGYAATVWGGGGGGGSSTGGAFGGAGGGGGGFIEAIIDGPLSGSYNLFVGAGGNGSASVGTGWSGGNGFQGVIFIEEYFY